MALKKELDKGGVIQLYLWCIAALFLCAFTSLYAQIPGLYGENGLYPASFVLEDKSVCADHDKRCKLWSKKKQCKLNAEWMLENCAKSCNSCKVGLEKFLGYPTLLWHTHHLGLTTETGMEFLCFLGILLSFYMLLTTSARDCLNFLILWILYFSLVQVGQVFLYYQWDILLLEACFIACLLAPWNLYIGPWNIFKCTRIGIYIQREHDMITWWLTKWLLFRLMFASGVVKLLWMDETWWNLTALNWHYESQCIPTSIAWYMQKLPIPLHRLSVVFTYLIEIVVPFLFFVPVRSIRIFAFFAQMLLQMMILLTGNYNFFNLLTMALCFSLVDDKFIQFNSIQFNCSLTSFCKFLKSKFRRKQSEKEELIDLDDGPNINNCQFGDMGQNSPKLSSTWTLCFTRLLAWIEMKTSSKRFLKFKDFLDKKIFYIVRKVLIAIMFLGVVICLLLLALKCFGLRYDKHEFIHSESKFTAKQFQTALTIAVITGMIIGLVFLSIEIISASLRSLLKEYSLVLNIVAFVQCLLFGFVVLWIFGISLVPLTDLDLKAWNKVPRIFIKQHAVLDKFKVFNAYGLFRSMTGVGGRPEVVIMGSDSLLTNSSWKEYNFIYKPGNLYSAPTFNVPHQPRLDWQMWFAALDDYQSNPWFINLLQKLLDGEESVLDLMAANPFKERPPKYIRSVLYRYHYTLNSTSFWNALFHSSHEKRWWTREYVEEYMPVVSKNDTALLKILKFYGLVRVKRIAEKPSGLLHKLIIAMRPAIRGIRTEFVIYAKFGILIAILVMQKWWKSYGVKMIQGKKLQIEKSIKRTLVKFSADAYVQETPETKMPAK
eukprot:Seg1445.5_Seg1445.6 transcript_id=Seg1445.5_Seg1445.6/GoldUCD/mRNA.D3Y31 product="Lipase maturation factor 2" protein_id=Seg1445.5_Seg1445.6/GoldUCD/D3Y31